MRDRFIETHPTEEQQQVVLSRGVHTPPITWMNMKKKTYEMSVLQPIDSKGYVFRCSREARLGTWSLEKEKRDKNSHTPTLVIYSINYSIGY